MATLTNGCTWLLDEEQSYYTTACTVWSSQRRHIAQPTSQLVRATPHLHISLSLLLSYIPLSLSFCSKHRSVGLINGRCQKCCQSILCLFGLNWNGRMRRGDGGMKGGGERRLERREGCMGEGSDRERREMERKESDGGRRDRGLWVQLSSAAHLSRRTSGTHRPITGALLISTQRALCQKSDTVRALWTSSPFKSTPRAFYVLNRSVCAHVMVCDCVLCSLSRGQRAPWWTKRREMRGASPTEPVIALRADFLSRQICFDALS